jgi:hypothetical protein
VPASLLMIMLQHTEQKSVSEMQPFDDRGRKRIIRLHACECTPVTENDTSANIVVGKNNHNKKNKKNIVPVQIGGLIQVPMFMYLTCLYSLFTKGSGLPPS